MVRASGLFFLSVAVAVAKHPHVRIFKQENFRHKTAVPKLNMSEILYFDLIDSYVEQSREIPTKSGQI